MCGAGLHGRGARGRAAAALLHGAGAVRGQHRRAAGRAAALRAAVRTSSSSLHLQPLRPTLAILQISHSQNPNFFTTIETLLFTARVAQRSKRSPTVIRRLCRFEPQSRRHFVCDPQIFVLSLPVSCTCLCP